jgi:hypothetical protein
VSSLQSRVEAAIRKVVNTTGERSYLHTTPTDLSWPDVIALAAEAEALRSALDEASEALTWQGAQAIIAKARAASGLYNERED